MKDGTANAGAGDEKDVVSTPRRKWTQVVRVRGLIFA
jgi:hypothetical protein